MAKTTRLNPYRVALQWIILALLAYLVIRPYIDRSYTADFEAYCPFGGLQAFSSFLANNSLACSMTTTQIFMGLGLVVGIIFMSKLFCSYICPIGTFTEWLSRTGKRFKMNFVVNGIADRVLRIVKYALLFTTFYFSITSSELFCKTFDPYYAVFTGFSSDVVISYAAMALLLAIPGSFFIKQFWCKYACPLGAASNIFSYSIVFLGITGLFVIITLVFNLAISWIWLLGGLSIAGAVLETMKVKTFGLSIFRIQRNTDSCTSCKLCDKVCPMSIKVSSIDKVKDVDCHLCGDCVASCPEQNTLKIHQKSYLWLPAVAVILLIALGLAFADKIHIPTVSLKWGNNQQMTDAGIYNQSGLTSIKCFGSSMSFANHMKEMNGVLGVETFVSDHSVKVYYDKAVIGDNDIKSAIFTPVKQLYAAPGDGLLNINVCEAKIDKFFDPNDAALLSTRFLQNKGILGMKTIFGEPVHAVIYFDPEMISAQRISAVIEEPKVTWLEDGVTRVAKTSFKVASYIEQASIPTKEYLSAMYEPVSMNFNGFNDYTSEELDTIEYNFKAGADPQLMEMPWYLLSHLSNNRGVVGFESVPTDQGFKLQLLIVKAKTNKEEVTKLLNANELTVHLSDGTSQTLKNPYRF